jgi:uncharacterized membrane protein
MSSSKTTPERLTAFSDGVFAVIITIMVLDLKPPAEPTLKALLPLWPTALSYAVSYLFIAIIWVNHHHLFKLTHEATPQLIWWNFAHLWSPQIGLGLVCCVLIIYLTPHVPDLFHRSMR